MAKRRLLLGVLAALMVAAVPAAAEEDVKEAAKEAEAVVETATEADAELLVPEMETIWGEWNKVGSNGEYNLTLAAYSLFAMPDGTVGDLTNMFAYEALEDGHYQVDIPAGVLPEGEMDVVLRQITEDDIERFGIKEDDYHYTKIGSPLLVVTVKTVDNSNPLATNPAELVGETAYAKSIPLYEFMEAVVLDSSWKIGDNVLVFGAENGIDLNNGANTGKYSFSKNDACAVYLSLSWEGGSSVRYYVTAVTENSITLVNMEDETDVLVLEKDEAGAPAEAAEAQTE